MSLSRSRNDDVKKEKIFLVIASVTILMIWLTGVPSLGETERRSVLVVGGGGVLFGGALVGGVLVGGVLIGGVLVGEVLAGGGLGSGVEEVRTGQ